MQLPISYELSRRYMVFIIDIALVVCSLQIGVYMERYGVRPSACLSVCPSVGRQQQNCSGIAAESPAGSRDRWIAEGSLQSDQ